MVIIWGDLAIEWATIHAGISHQIEGKGIQIPFPLEKAFPFEETFPLEKT